LAGIAGEEIWLLSLGSMAAEQLTPLDSAGRLLHPHGPTGRGSRIYFMDQDTLWVIDLALLAAPSDNE
jgi:hypothetical protein